MNPPFTRDSLRHDQFSREDELSLKRAGAADLLNGPSASFSCAAAFVGVGMYAVLCASVMHL